jgi:hypothetical protein
MEASNAKVNDIKTMFSSIQNALHDGPPIKSPPRKQRSHGDHSTLRADKHDPLSPEAAGKQ